MFHDKLSFRFNRCDHNTFIHPKPKQPLSPIMQILKRLCPISEVLKESAPPTPTRKAKKPRKKRKKSKGRIIKKSLDESKPIFIAIISAAVYRSLTQKKDVKTFSITLCQINQILDSLNSQTDNSTLYIINKLLNGSENTVFRVENRL
jgi:hypothetical protein